MDNRKIIFWFIFLGLMAQACKNNNVNNERVSVAERIKNVDFGFEHVIREPLTKSSKKPPMLILLHGLGSNENDLFKFSNSLDSRLLIVSPRGPITISEGDYSWFSLTVKQGQFHYVESEIDANRKKLLAYIDQLVTTYDVNPEAVYVGGFSQGAIMSLYLGMTAPDKIAGVISLSGQLYPNFRKQTKLGKDFDDLDILITHGTEDNVLPYDDMKKSALYLLSSGANVETKWYETGHTVNKDNLKDFIYWISTKVDKHY